MLLQLSIGKRLFIGAILMIILIVATGLSGLWQQHKSNEYMKVVVNDQIPKLIIIDGMRDAVRYKAQAIRDITLQADFAYLKNEIKQMKLARQQYNTLRDELLVVVNGKADLVEQINALQAKEESMEGIFNAILDLNLSEDQAGAFEKIKSDLRPAQKNFFDQLDQLKTNINNQVTHEAKLSQERFEQSWNLTVVFILAAVVLGALISFRLTRDITKPMSKMIQVFSEVANHGNFAARVELPSNQNDEIAATAQSLNSFLSQLQITIHDVNMALDKVANGQFDTKLNNPLNGDLEHLRQGVNASVESVALTMEALNEVMLALYEGNFSTRMNDQVPRDLRNNVDQAVVSIHDVVSRVNEVVDAMASGDFTQRVKVTARGELADLVVHINESLDVLGQAINDSVDMAKALSNGDFTHLAPRKFEGSLGVMQQAIQQSIENIGQALGEIVQVAEQVTQASVEINHGNQDLNDRTQQQASLIDQSAVQMQTMTQSVLSAATSIDQSDQFAKKAEQEATTGAEIMQSTMLAMEEMRSASQKVSEITALIDSIAFQTNLLALNAAVEAARAGEHGRGFAVVASEVRALAQKSSDAAKDIRGLIDNTIAQIVAGSDKANQSAQALNRIEEAIANVGKLVSSVSQSSRSQQNMIQQVNGHMGVLESSTQQNAALVEEVAAATDRMQEQTERLSALVQRFRLRADNNRGKVRLLIGN